MRKKIVICKLEKFSPFPCPLYVNFKLVNIFPKCVALSAETNSVGHNGFCGLEEISENRKKIYNQIWEKKKDLGVGLWGSCHTNFTCALSQWGRNPFWSESCSSIWKCRSSACKSSWKISFESWPFLHFSMFLSHFLEMELLEN